MKKRFLRISSGRLHCLLDAGGAGKCRCQQCGGADCRDAGRLDQRTSLRPEHRPDPGPAGKAAGGILDLPGERRHAGATHGTLFTDVDSGNEYAPDIRIAVQQGWLSGYTDGSFRPDNGVTLEETCTAALKLLGYDVTTLSGSFPAAQLNKAGSLGLRTGLSAVQGQGLTLEDAAVLFYNALTASTAENQDLCRHAGLYRDGWPDRPVPRCCSAVWRAPLWPMAPPSCPLCPAAVYRNDTVANRRRSEHLRCLLLPAPAPERSGSTPARRRAASRRSRPAPAPPPV